MKMMANWAGFKLRKMTFQRTMIFHKIKHSMISRCLWHDKYYSSSEHWADNRMDVASFGLYTVNMEVYSSLALPSKLLHAV